ncbi:MAG TPA: type II toxin-antitoxin system VapC family toxin [Nodularia sp. (in: cyanobacteria)]|nr:type II toxin-antitoxin system VapC family toxin [Nodularia sp. (in: cyanobacteria)]
MKLLLDTHIWIWYLLGDTRISENIQKAISDEINELWLSPISIWETLLLAEKGRLILKPSPEKWVQNSLQQLDTKQALLSNDIAILSRQLDLVHQDPADRFIAATAVHYRLTLVTVDGNLTKASCLSTLS